MDMTTLTPMLDAARKQAQERANREGARMTVYTVAHDRYGRDAVFYVRSEQEGPPEGEPKYNTVARIDPETWKLYRDGKLLAESTNQTDIFDTLHRLCPSSWDHAIRYEGYRIESPGGETVKSYSTGSGS